MRLITFTLTIFIIANLSYADTDQQERQRKRRSRYSVEKKYIGKPKVKSPNITDTILGLGGQRPIDRKLAKMLVTAYETGNINICRNLPEVQSKSYKVRDYVYQSAGRSEWHAYCMALVKRDSALCPPDLRNRPNLRANCRWFFKQLAEVENTTPQFCFKQLGVTIFKRENFRGCLNQWKKKTFGDYRISVDELLKANKSIKPFTKMDFAIMRCLEKPYNKQDKCIFDLALKMRDKRVCKVLYPKHMIGSQWNQQNCIGSIK